MKAIKIGLACSAGGHLAELKQLRSVYEQWPHFFVTFRRPDSEVLAESNIVFFVERPARSVLKTLRCIGESFDIVRKERPDVIISTGADAAIPFCVLGKIFGARLVFIESFCRTRKPSWSARILYPFADLFIYQWKSLERFFPKATFGGSIF